MFLSIFYLILILFLVYKFITLDCNPVLAIYDLFETIFKAKRSLRKKTVWILGSSQGIGEGLAYAFAQQQCRLVLTSTSESKLQEVKRRCLAKGLKADDVLLLPYDVSDFEQTKVAFKRVLDEFGQLDVLVCNAARFYMEKVEDDSFDEIKRTFDINYLSHVNAVKLVVRHWLQHGLRGQVLATSSIASILESPYTAFYVGTKKALNIFFRYGRFKEFRKLKLSKFFLKTRLSRL